MIDDVFWCPQCGKGVASDVDGCCSTCGADLILPDVLRAIATEAARQEREECAQYLDEQEEIERKEHDECAADDCNAWARDASACAHAAKRWAKAIRARGRVGG